MQGWQYILFTSSIIAILTCNSASSAQELYPLSEPASTMPKNTLGVRLFTEAYQEVGRVRTMSGLRVMYGVSSKLSVYGTAIFSNHHGKKFPEDMPFHNTPERGAKYPYKLNGGHLYAKYRFVSKDKKNAHFRMAAYAEGTYVKTTHHESEANLAQGDTKGVGGGIITTYLYKKFAASLTIGIIQPFGSTEMSPDVVVGLPDIPIRVRYGTTVPYQLSFGYLLLPKKYNNYKQTNLNLYLELTGKTFGDANLDLYYGTNEAYSLGKGRYPEALLKGYYLDVSPGIQAIINSNLRIDFSVTFPWLGKSWAKLYPVYTLGIQYYIYL